MGLGYSSARMSLTVGGKVQNNSSHKYWLHCGPYDPADPVFDIPDFLLANPKKKDKKPKDTKKVITKKSRPRLR